MRFLIAERNLLATQFFGFEGIPIRNTMDKMHVHIFQINKTSRLCCNPWKKWRWVWKISPGQHHLAVHHLRYVHTLSDKNGLFNYVLSSLKGLAMRSYSPSTSLNKFKILPHSPSLDLKCLSNKVTTWQFVDFFFWFSTILAF